jgi:hypothetical protein
MAGTSRGATKCWQSSTFFLHSRQKTMSARCGGR